MSGKRILIAVDFGTTFTGVAYSNPYDANEEPLLFTSWSGRSGDKVPSIIASERSRGESPFKWGNLVRYEDKCHEWFKLGLDPMKYKASSSVDLSDRYPSKEEEESKEECEIKSKQYTVDFLTAVRKRVMECLEEWYKLKSSNIGVEWMITVPAVWSPEAKNVTKECAEAAGMGSRADILMTSEPEAAANYALKWYRHSFSVGQNIMVLDAGGGTVDLITYRIAQLEPYLKVEESGICTGGKCGGVFVNRAFEKLVAGKFEKAGKLIPERARSEVMKNFENSRKKEFDFEEKHQKPTHNNGQHTEVDDDSNEDSDGEEDNCRYFPVPGAKDNRTIGIQGGMLKITDLELKEAFDHVINNVIYLAQCQVASISPSYSYGSSLSAVIVVGGFGQCQYLIRRLKQEPYLNGAEVYLCPNAWTSVVRGAVLKGLRDRSETTKTVVSRKSTVNLGTDCAVPFIEGTHYEPYKYFCECERIYKCENIFCSYLQRGHDLKEDTPISIPFYHYLAVGKPLKVNTDIYENFNDIAPQYSTQDCKLVGTLKADLSSVPTHELEQIIAQDGTRYYKIWYTIAATFHSADISSAHFELIYKGQRYSGARFRFSNSTRMRPTK